MGIFKRGTAIVEGHVGTRAALKAYLGARLIWDGTRSAFISVPGMRVSLSAPRPSLSVGSTLDVDGPAPIYYPGVLHPTVSAGSRALAPAAGLSVDVIAPTVSASSKVVAPPMIVTLVVLPAEAGLVDNGTITPPRFRFDVAMPEPVVTADAAVTVGEPMRVYYPGELHPAVTAGSTATPQPAAVAITAHVPAVSADALAGPPKATIAVGMRTPTVSAGANATPPPMVVTLALRTPVVQAIHEVPMGMDKSGTQSVAGGAWTKITGWLARSGYPDTVITSDGLALRPGTYSSISFKATIENSRQLRLQIMKNGVQIGFIDSGSNVVALTCTASNVTIVEGDLITFEANPTAGRIIQPGASNTYAIATPA